MKNGNEELEMWKSYQSGIDYKTSIGLYDDVNKNTRFYEKRMWDGVQAGGLPTPVLPLIPRIVDHKVNTVMGDDIKINYSIDGIDDMDNSPDSEALRQLAKQLSAYAMTLEEANFEASKDEQVLLDAALSGDGLEYFYWEPSYNAGNGVKGQVCSLVIDNVNYLPANPNSDDVQSQVKIQIAFRQMVEDLKREAKANGIPKDEIDKITPDEETENQAGEMSKKELDKPNKAMCLLTMWKKDGTVWFNKATRYARITKGDIDSKLSLYPLAMMNWQKRKNCCHGVSEVKGLIPNQIAINKLVAMIIMAVMHVSIPKMIYDSSRMSAPTNMIGGSVGVTGDPNQVAKYLTPGQLSADIYKVVELLINYTKEMVAATDAAMGELNMDNTSALVVLQKASAIPLRSISRRYWRFKEDKARIYMDFFVNKYNVERTLTYKDQGVNRTFNFDGSKYGDVQWRVKVDVGASSHWSEITSMQTLDNLLINKQITFAQYLERLPNGIIPMKDKLLQEIAGADLDHQVMIKMLADYVEGLPPEIQAQIRAMKPEEMEMKVKEMILQSNNQAAAAM